MALLKHVYYPATQTGFKFDSSVYGMIYKVSMRKQMSIDGNGVISDGTEKSYVSFNYPTTASSLTDTPAFTQWTESPGGTHSITSSTDVGEQTKTFIVTRPDSSLFWMRRDTNASNLSDGLVLQSGIYAAAAATLPMPMIRADLYRCSRSFPMMRTEHHKSRF